MGQNLHENMEGFCRAGHIIMWKFLMDLYFVEGKSEIIIVVLIFADHQLNYIVSAFSQG